MEEPQPASSLNARDPTQESETIISEQADSECVERATADQELESSKRSASPARKEDSFLKKYLSESSNEEENEDEKPKQTNNARNTKNISKSQRNKDLQKESDNRRQNAQVQKNTKGKSKKKSEKSNGIETRKADRKPSTKWKNLTHFEDDDVECDEEMKTKQSTPKSRCSKTAESRRYTARSDRRSMVTMVTDTAEYSESSTESDEDDDRVMDGKVNAADLPSEYWQIQRIVKFLRISNPTTTVLCLCALKDFNLSLEISQMAIREVNGLQLLINLLKTDDYRCKIGSLQILLMLTTNSKYNIDKIVNSGGVAVIVDLVATEKKEVQGMAAATLANLARSSRARNILRKCGGIRKLVNLLSQQDERAKRKPLKSHEQQAMEMEVSRCAALALWSCSKSKHNRATIFKAGSVPLLAKLIKVDQEEVLIPIVGLVQECAIEARYRQAFQQENMIEAIVRHLQTENEELQIYCANAIFKCAEDEETRRIVNRFGGLEPLVDLLSRHANKGLLAAVTGAIWKCAISFENAKRFLELDVMQTLLKYLQNPEEQQPEEVQIHIVGALAELSKIGQGRRELLACKGCRTLVNLSTTPNEKLVEQVSRAIAACSKDRECRDLINQLDGLRLLWSLLKSNNPKVISSAAWGIYGLTEDTPEAWENARSFVGGLELIVTLLKGDDIEVLTCTCAAISNIANDYENIGVLTDYGVVPLLARMTDMNDIVLRQHLAEAITRCSKWGSNAQSFCEEGAVEAMVEYLTIDDTILKRSAVRALYQLARNPDSCIIMHSKGVVKPLLQMVGSNDAALQEAAAGCLLNIRKLAMANEKARTADKKSAHKNAQSDDNSVKPS